MGVWLLQAREYAGAILSFGVALLMLPPIAIGWASARSIRRRGYASAHSLRLDRSSKRVVKLQKSRYTTFNFLWICVIALLLFLRTPFIEAMLPANPSFGRGQFHAWAQVAPFMAVFPLAYLVGWPIRKHKHMGIGLAPDGLYHWSWFGGCFWSWEWIEKVDAVVAGRVIFVDLVIAEPQTHPWDPEENFVAKLDFYRRRQSRLPVAALTVDPAVPLYAIEFYRRHPELRHELGTQAGVDRVRRGELPDVIEEVRAHGRFKAA